MGVTNTKSFIERCIDIYEDKYTYKNTVYTGTHSDTIITCKIHGDFHTIPNRFLRGKGCPKCAVENKTHSLNLNCKRDFVSKSNKIHHFKYNYSKTNYINAVTKVNIVCKYHGEFTQYPYVHLRGSGCPRCGNNSQSSKIFLSNEEFIKRFELLESGLKLESNYKGMNKFIYVSDNLGIIYKITPSNLFQSPPSILAAVNKIEAFIKKAKSIHGDKYDYSLTKYKNTKSKVVITCKEHGNFQQVASAHLQGRGCYKCIDHIGWSKTQWNTHCKNKKNSEPKVYIINCYNNEESFVKIGITSNSIYERFGKTSLMPYSYEILKEIKGSPDFVWDKEKELHRLCKPFKYKPLKSFGGETECFTLATIDLLKIENIL